MFNLVGSSLTYVNKFNIWNDSVLLGFSTKHYLNKHKVHRQINTNYDRSQESGHPHNDTTSGAPLHPEAPHALAPRAPLALSRGTSRIST